MAVRRAAPPERMPWSWVLPAGLVMAVTLVVGIVRYPGLPARLPVHFDLAGAADRSVPTTVATAFVPVAVQFVATGLVIVSAAAVLRSPQRPAHSIRLVVRAVLVLAACMALTGFFVAQRIWSGASSLGTGTLAAIIVTPLIGILAVVGASIVAGRAGTGPDGTDPDRWHGPIYLNRDDPALFVPKRYGIGWTFNFGRPASWVLLGAVLAVVVAGPVLGAFLS